MPGTSSWTRRRRTGRTDPRFHGPPPGLTESTASESRACGPRSLSHCVVGENLAHPTRFERVASNFGGSRRFKPSCSGPKQQFEMVACPRNHLKLRCQIAQIGRPNRAAFLRPQVLMVAPSRNQHHFIPLCLSLLARFLSDAQGVVDRSCAIRFTVSCKSDGKQICPMAGSS